MKTKITSNLRNSVGASVYFEAESPIPITEEMAMKAQLDMGYHPAGYGFDDFKVTPADPVLFRYKATWNCRANCD